MTTDRSSFADSRDQIFEIGRRAKEAIDKYGKDAVIDSSLGVLLREDGRLWTLDSVYDLMGTLDRADIASYSQIAGDLDYLKAVEDTVFSKRPHAHIRTVAMPGGTGAISKAIWAYADEGDPVLSHDYYWSNYKSICTEYGRDFRVFDFLTDDYSFNIGAYREAVASALEDRDRLVTIINSPGNNPTGYSLTDEEWDEVIGVLKEASQDKEKKITLLVDLAYIEFAGDGSQKDFLSKFGDLPENIMVILAFTMSKSYTAYGLRCGAAIGLSSSEEEADYFYKAFAHSARTNWSNTNHLGQRILVELSKPENIGAYHEELAVLQAAMKERADLFTELARQNDLSMIPYFGGFFIMIPTEKSQEIQERLVEENIFAVAMPKGVRIAVSAINKKEIEKLVPILARIKREVEEG